MILSLKCKIDVGYFQLLLCLRLNSVCLRYPMFFLLLLTYKLKYSGMVQRLENSELGMTYQAI